MRRPAATCGDPGRAKAGQLAGRGAATPCPIDTLRQKNFRYFNATNSVDVRKATERSRLPATHRSHSKCRPRHVTKGYEYYYEH